MLSFPVSQTFPETSLPRPSDARTDSARSDATAMSDAIHPATNLFLPVATASVAVHLILIAWFGSGVPPRPTRIVREQITAVAPVTVENVELQPEPQPPELIQPRQDTPAPDAPAPVPAANVDLPPLPTVQPIAAVPTSSSVAFGVAVDGPVRLVSDAAGASGALRGRRPSEPIALDLNSANDLLLPTLAYPPRAKRQRLTGTVLVEFRTTPTGEISNVRVRESSGHAVLDEAARDNVAAGRWKGAPGYYVKALEFSLQ